MRLRNVTVKPHAECKAYSSKLHIILQWGLLNGRPLGQANTLIYNMWQYSSCSLQNCVFCSSKVFGYCTMYSYRGAHTADMWVNTAFSCRICHIMPSEICHSFFMLLQDPIFISTCMLTSGWLKSKSVSNYQDT